VLIARHEEQAKARQALAIAAGIYQDPGADWDLRRADARLRQRGIRAAAPARGPGPPAGTP
jgi:hypothetical protein